jgi:hypothetical protein
MKQLSSMSIVVEDSMSTDDVKNVIFRVSDDSVSMCGRNQLITYRIPLDKDKVEILKSDTKYMQIKSKELFNFLSTYKTLSKTKIKDITLELQNTGKISCKVTEVRKDNAEESISSSWVFDNIILTENLKKSLNLASPSDTNTLDITRVKWFTDSFLPCLTSSLDTYGYMIFTTEKCIVLNPSYTIIGNNDLENWQGFKLSYKVMSFIDKTFNKDDSLVFSKTGKHIYIKDTKTNSEVFLSFLDSIPPLQIYLNMVNTEHSIKLDRKYLRDILKRLSLLKEAVVVDIDCNEHKLTLKNSKFRQTLDMLAYLNIENYDNIRFKIMPDIIDKIMIGNDKNEDVIYLYYNTSQGNNMIIFSDENNSWYSVVRVKTF